MLRIIFIFLAIIAVFGYCFGAAYCSGNLYRMSRESLGLCTFLSLLSAISLLGFFALIPSILLSWSLLLINLAFLAVTLIILISIIGLFHKGYKMISGSGKARYCVFAFISWIFTFFTVSIFIVGMDLSIIARFPTDNILGIISLGAFCCLVISVLSACKCCQYISSRYIEKVNTRDEITEDIKAEILKKINAGIEYGLSDDDIASDIEYAYSLTRGYAESYVRLARIEKTEPQKTDMEAKAILTKNPAEETSVEIKAEETEAESETEKEEKE